MFRQKKVKKKEGWAIKRLNEKESIEIKKEEKKE